MKKLNFLMKKKKKKNKIPFDTIRAYKCMF